MSGNSVYRVVVDNYPDEPADYDAWLSYLKKHEWEMGFYVDHRDNERDAALGLWTSWRGGPRVRYFSIASARGHVNRLVAHGASAHVEGGTIAWVTP